MGHINPQAVAQFDFDLGKAVLDQLLAQFSSLQIGQLSKEGLSVVRNEPGVYQLFLNNQLVYVGKADNAVAKRLSDHLWKLTGRKGIELPLLGFKALYIHRNWAPSVHESVLIDIYRGMGESDWNTSGFGNNDPGRNRDHSVTEESHFDSRFPIDPLYVPQGIGSDCFDALDLLLTIKQALPYIFRFETKHKKHYRRGSPKYNGLYVTIPSQGMPARELLAIIVNTFPAGWQATFLPGRLILYEEKTDYPNAILTLRSETAREFS